MIRRTRPTGRAAFTIIELMVVVVIIALLAALLLAGVSRVAKMGTMATASNDISQLSTAAEQFKQAWGFYPPSGLTVVNPATGVLTPVNFKIPATVPVSPPTNLVQAQELASYELYKKKYPRWLSTAAAGTATGLANGGAELNGAQSMVYFLGGPTQTGWATDAPVAPAVGATATVPPYFDFKQDRLAPGSAYGLSALPVYLDPYKNPPGAPNGTPYVYLAAGTSGKYPACPCFGVYPLQESAAKFANSGTVQIISAGEDGVVGTNLSGGVYVAGQGNWGEGTPGADDLGNVNNGNKLGVGR
jgi:prepilin-type N-terminal cleavage/methylation domain-containing protein